MPLGLRLPISLPRLVAFLFDDPAQNCHFEWYLKD